MIVVVLVAALLMTSCQPDGGVSKNLKEQSPPSSTTQSPPAPIPNDEPAPLPNLGIPYTHEEMELYRQLKPQIWKSPLGQLFTEYLSNIDTTKQVLNLSSDITERVFSVPGEELIRIAALQIMVEDLYAKGGFTPEISYRLTLLDGNISQRQIILNTVPIEKLLDDAPIFLAIGLLAGSPELALQTRGFIAAIGSSTKRALLKRQLSSFFPFENRALNLRRLLSLNLIYKYKPLRALHGTFSTFGAYSFAYIYFFRQRRFMGKGFATGRLLLSGIEELVNIGEL